MVLLPTIRVYYPVKDTDPMDELFIELSPQLLTEVMEDGGIERLDDGRYMLTDHGCDMIRKATFPEDA